MNIFGRLFGKNPSDDGKGKPQPEKIVPASPEGTDYKFQWYPAPENPFGIRLLDCRPLTHHVVSATSKRSVAERFCRLRSSDGRDLIGAQITDSIRVATSLKFPHNGQPLEGILFKAPSMDVKWDIYIYQSIFLCAQSWSGELRYRAFATVGESEIHITEIECPGSEIEMAPSHVFFLLGTHALGCVLPHRLPRDTPEDPLTMANLSFSLFGNRACFATFEDITHIPIARPPAS